MKPVLVISLALNLVFVVTVIGGVSMTGRLFHSNVLQPAYERSVSLYDVLPIESGDFVILGDSLVAAAPWHELLPDVPIRNRGIIGDTSGGILARLDQVVAGRPRAVMLMTGTFDVLGGVSRRTTVANVTEIIERLQSELPEVDVLLMGVLPRNLESAAGINRLNREFAEIAERAGIDFLDLRGDFLGPDGTLDPAVSNDGLHLNGAGYLRWRERLEPWVEARMAPLAAVAEAT